MVETQTPLSGDTSDASQPVTNFPFGQQGTTKIVKLLLDGFKSFGKRTELYFEDGFNCIVGPNGSGKSNVLDALCFVLGKSSSKSLRAEKTANLIYNGGKTRPPAKSAEVSISFDNSKKIFPLDDSEIKVSRIVSSDGQSKYKINNKTRTRQEVLELLAAARIYPDGYNIILQGDIVRFVEMSSVERRQIIEEIAGISIYEEKKQSALNELQKVEEKLNEAEIILKERSTHLKELKKDRDQALKYKELNDRIKQNKASYVKIQLNKKDAELAKVQSKTAKHKEVHDKYLAQIKELRAQIMQRRERIREISLQVDLAGSSNASGLAKEIENIRVELATKKTRLDTIHHELSKIQSRRSGLTQTLSELDERMAGLKKSKDSLLERKQQVASQLTELDQKIVAFRSKHKLDDSGTTLEKQLEQLDQELDSLGKQLQSQREQQQELIREKDKIEFQLQTIDSQIAKVKDLEAAHQEEIKAIKQKQTEFKKAVLELNQLLTEDSKLAQESASLKKEIGVLEEDLAKLNVKNAAVQESISGNIAVQKVIENKKQIGDIFGTIGELGESPTKYSLALEIAAGTKIHSVVVEDDKIAAKAINFLKATKCGTATFLPLNKVKGSGPSEVKKLLGSPGVHGRAIDLISFDAKFRPAFEFVFGNTLVVENLDVARKIGIGNAKMVTLDGDITELSGSMTGGFRGKSKGAFKDTDLAKRIKEAEGKVAEFHSRLSSITKKRASNEEQIQRLRELKATLEGEIIKAEKSLHLDSTDLDASKDQKQRLQEQGLVIDKKIRELNTTLTELTKKVTNLKIEKSKRRDEMTQLRSPTVLAELNAYEEKRTGLREALAQNQAEEKALDVQINDVVKRDQDNARKVLKDAEKETQQFSQESERIGKDVTTLQAAQKEKEAQQAKMFSQFKTLFDERSRLGDEVTNLETKTFEVEDTARKEEVNLNLVSMEEAKVKAERAGLQTEFDQYGEVELDLTKSEDDIKKEIRDFEKMRETIGSVNMRALEIYETVEKEFNALNEKKGTLLSEKEDVLKLMNEIETSKKTRFMATYNEIQNHFKGIFGELFAKGAAGLELENPENPFEAGVLIKVLLTGTKYLDIRSLSGGEKTLTALAFIFSIQEYAPATFYILDEVDAALDKRNAEKLAKLIQQYSKKAQYVVISHNDSVVSEANTLYGVSLGEHSISNVVSLKI